MKTPVRINLMLYAWGLAILLACLTHTGKAQLTLPTEEEQHVCCGCGRPINCNQPLCREMIAISHIITKGRFDTIADWPNSHGYAIFTVDSLMFLLDKLEINCQDKNALGIDPPTSGDKLKFEKVDNYETSASEITLSVPLLLGLLDMLDRDAGIRTEHNRYKNGTKITFIYRGDGGSNKKLAVDFARIMYMPNGNKQTFHIYADLTELYP